MEQEGIDRRTALLDINAVRNEHGKYRGEIFDTITRQQIWLGIPSNEDEALRRANEVLERLEHTHGFGSISLYHKAS